MSNPTDGRGLAADAFDDDEIDWDDQPNDPDGTSPIEGMVRDSMEAVVPDEDRVDEGR